jgi:hypothetical protein
MGVKEFWKNRGYWQKIALVLIVLFIVVIVVLSYYMPYYHRPMGAYPYELCDNDGDGDCDKADYELITQAIGGCEDQGVYNELADANHDGCVTESDREQLFPTIPEEQQTTESPSLSLEKFKAVLTKERAIISADEKRYNKGETIKVTLENRLDEPIFIINCFPIGLEIKEDGEWKSRFYGECEIVYLQSMIKSGEKIIFMEYDTGYYPETYSLGTYRIRLEYLTGCDKECTEGTIEKTEYGVITCLDKFGKYFDMLKSCDGGMTIFSNEFKLEKAKLPELSREEQETANIVGLSTEEFRVVSAKAKEFFKEGIPSYEESPLGYSTPKKFGSFEFRSGPKTVIVHYLHISPAPYVMYAIEEGEITVLEENLQPTKQEITESLDLTLEEQEIAKSLGLTLEDFKEVRQKAEESFKVAVPPLAYKEDFLEYYIIEDKKGLSYYGLENLKIKPDSRFIEVRYIFMMPLIRVICLVEDGEVKVLYEGLHTLSL